MHNFERKFVFFLHKRELQGGSNMTGTDLCVNKPHCAAAVRLVYTQISPRHIWTTLYFYEIKFRRVCEEWARAMWNFGFTEEFASRRRVKEQNLKRRFSVTLEVCCVNKEMRLSCLVAHSVGFNWSANICYVQLSHPILLPFLFILSSHFLVCLKNSSHLFAVHWTVHR